MAFDENMGRNILNAALLARALAGSPDASTAQAATGASGAGTQAAPSTTPTAMPEQQILEGANSPVPAAQSAALQEQRIQESQNPQLMQQNTQQQAAQNSPGAMQPQQSALGNFSQEQIQQGQQGAQTASEKGWWDSVKTALTGDGLQGDELKNWRKNMSLGTALGQLGAAIGGQTTGGRLGEGVYQLGAGSMAAKNAELREGAQNSFMQAAARALGIEPTTQSGTQAQTQGSSMTQSQPAQQTLPNGESSLNDDMQGLIDDLDVQLERLRRLGGQYGK